MPTPLLQVLRGELAADRALRLDEYMQRCLSVPPYGYYRQARPLGRAGDFITAPEISQMFGELLGLWLYERWQGLGAPEAFALFEPGGGRGTLMRDALRAIGQMARGADFRRGMQIYFLEIHPELQMQQAQAVLPHAARFISELTDLPALPLLAVANEFLDCLPVRGFAPAEDGAGFDELGVGFHSGHLGYMRLPLAEDMPDLDAAGGYVERSAMAEDFAQLIARHILQHSGAALLMDYGYTQDGTLPGPSLQAVKAHENVSPFVAPGESDLTALVNFPRLVLAAQAGGAQIYGPLAQGVFLQRLGLTTRAEQLAQAAPQEKAALAAAVARLTGARAMGRLFQVLALCSRGQAPPPGFA